MQNEEIYKIVSTHLQGLDSEQAQLVGTIAEYCLVHRLPMARVLPVLDAIRNSAAEARSKYPTQKEKESIHEN